MYAQRIRFRLQAMGAVIACLILATTVACKNRTSGGAQTDAGARVDEQAEGPCPGVPSADREKVVAQVGTEAITVCDVTEALNKMSPYLRKAYEAPEKRQQFVDNMVRFELIAQEAQRRGYANDEEVQRVRKQMMIQRLNKELQDSVRLSDITEEDMRRYYQEHEGDYHKAEMVRIARILLPTKAEAERVLALAKSKANDSRYFRQLAQEHSKDGQTREYGGDLPYFPRTEQRREEDPEVDPALVEKAFALEMNNPLYEGVVQTSDGWNVIRLRGRRKARDLSFEDVKRQIQHRLHRDKLQEARDQLVVELRKNAKITINDGELAKVRVDVPPPEAVAVPGRPPVSDDAPPQKAPRAGPLAPPSAAAGG